MDLGDLAEGIGELATSGGWRTFFFVLGVVAVGVAVYYIWFN